MNEQIIQIPYASNQYYIMTALFSNPKKRWEQDEILEKFGEVESEEGWRKVYDAHLAINRKVGFKLIDYRDKLFRINPEYLSAIVTP
jgi:DNA-binding response OmpR family regulator